MHVSLYRVLRDSHADHPLPATIHKYADRKRKRTPEAGMCRNHHHLDVRTKPKGIQILDIPKGS